MQPRSSFWPACAAAAIAFGLAAPSHAQLERAAEQPCRLLYASAPAAFAECGLLRVAEDPLADDGPTIDLFWARIAALSSTPRADPLLVITGGPGQSAVDFYLLSRVAFEEVRRDRDLILLDQRGTGRSASGFTCSVPENLSLETAATPELEQFIAVCLAALEHDPRLYTTSVAVRDLEALRAALGIPLWNVYGVSYGTRVAQHYLRRFPERVRALILDGVVPADLALGPDVAIHAQSALDAIFARCAADSGCAAAFGDLPARFREVMTRLAAEPIETQRGVSTNGPATERPRFGARELQTLTRFMSYSGETAALLPLLFSRAYDRDYAPLVGQAETLLRDLPEALSFPMSNAVLCTEDVPLRGAPANLDDTYLGTTIIDALREICARWPAGSIDADFKTPVASDKPTLLLSGDTDPITPPEYAERAIAGGLTNSRHVVGVGQGHGLAPVGCVPRILRAFLEMPDPRALDAECLELEPPQPFFLTPMGPAP